MSLERLVKEFAERVRAELLARIEAEKNSDTAVVKWQGFDNDGKPIVKNLDKIETAEGLGNVAQKKGTKLIYDKNSSAEYKKRKKAKPELIKKQDIPLVLRTRRISRAPLLTADLFNVNFSILFDVPITAFYMMTYTTISPPKKEGYSNNIVAPIGFYPSTIFSDSETETVPNYTEAATGGTTYRIVGAIASSRSYAIRQGGNTLHIGSASASFSGLGAGINVSTTGKPQTYPYYDFETAVEVVVTKTTQGGLINMTAQGTTYVTMGQYGPSTYFTGRAGCDYAWMFISFQKAIYYFQTPQNAGSSNDGIRTINLNDIVPNEVYTSKIVHNYASREGDNAFVYTIFYVIDVDMNQSDEDITYDTEDHKMGKKLFGKITRYIVHTKLDLTTGTYEHKINASPNTGSPLSPPFLVEYDYPDYVPGTSSWLVIAEYDANAIAGASTSMRLYKLLIDDWEGNDYDSFNPEAVWRESYEGDWIYVYRNLLWDYTAASTSVSDSDIYKFLKLSYKNSFFWEGMDNQIASNQLSPPVFKRQDITGTAWEGNTPLTGTIYDIQTMYGFVNNIPDVLLPPDVFALSNYFDGSVSNVPNDYSSWRNWTFLEHGTYQNNWTYGEKTDISPDFSLAENVLESGDKTGDRLSYYNTWFNFVPLDSIRIVSYEITTEVISGLNQQIVTLITASQGYTFNEGDAIEISEDTAINGQYNIYQVNSNTQFKISIPGSTNTSGAVASTGVATKLPPAA